MKTTIELAKECGFTDDMMHKLPSPLRHLIADNLQTFRKAVEADFVSRCENVAEVVEFKMADFSKPCMRLRFKLWLHINS